MSLDDGHILKDRAYEEDFENGIAFQEAVGERADAYWSELEQGRDITVDGMKWDADEVCEEISGPVLIDCVARGDIDHLRELINDKLVTLAEEDIESESH